MKAPGSDPGTGSPLSPPPDVDFVRERLSALRAQAPIRSSDGRVQIGGPALNAPDKLVLLRFVEDVRGRASRLLGIDFDGPAYAIAIHAEGGKPGAPQIDVRVSRPADVPIRIALRNPEGLHAPDLTERLCSALLRADALANGYSDPPGEPTEPARRCAPYPAWFGAGLARLLDAQRRQADAEAVLARWSDAQLPGVLTLAESFSPYAATDAALASQLVAWFLAAPERAARHVQLRTEFVHGVPWSSALFARAVGCKPLPGCADVDWDLWLLARRWVVLVPGTTQRALVLRTRDQLRVWPGTPGTPLDALPIRAPIEPHALIDLRKAPWMQATAVFKIATTVRIASGRDEAYNRMAMAYASFFAGLRDGESKRRLTASLAAAEGLLAELEAAAESSAPMDGHAVPRDTSGKESPKHGTTRGVRE